MRVGRRIVQMPEPFDKAAERSHGRPRLVVHAKKRIRCRSSATERSEACPIHFDMMAATPVSRLAARRFTARERHLGQPLESVQSNASFKIMLAMIHLGSRAFRRRKIIAS
jgi:hypothetical protein